MRFAHIYIFAHESTIEGFKYCECLWFLFLHFVFDLHARCVHENESWKKPDIFRLEVFSVCKFFRPLLSYIKVLGLRLFSVTTAVVTIKVGLSKWRLQRAFNWSRDIKFFHYTRYTNPFMNKSVQVTRPYVSSLVEVKVAANKLEIILTNLYILVDKQWFPNVLFYWWE